MSKPAFCCPMREKFLIGIVGVDQSIEMPIDAADFMDFDLKTRDDRPILRIKYCPFCGKPAAGPLRVGEVRTP